MQADRTIANLLRATKPIRSVEFFPPKNEAGGKEILRVATQLRNAIHPDFVSITYGAGGTTRERTLRYAQLLKEELGFEVMPHLTCVGSSRSELHSILQGYYDLGFRNIMALRGDPPKGETAFRPHPEGLQFASDLVKYIHEHFRDICIGVAGYPEKHPEAPDPETDLDHLRDKCNAGAHFITTQLFFDNADYWKFVTACRQRGITLPILPGILPVVSLSQVERFCKMCGARIPEVLHDKLRQAGDDPEKVEAVGIDWAHAQVSELLARGAPGFHLYILNRCRSALALVERLGPAAS